MTQTPDPRCDGVVLAGGRGRRFGRPKASVRIGHQTLVERAVDALRARCRRVVVVARFDTSLPTLDVPVVYDEPGPPSGLVGILSGLRVVDAPRVAVLGCDVLPAAPLLDRVLDPAGDGNRAAADVHGLQPLCARYERRDAMAAAEAMLGRGELRLRAFTDALAVTAVPAQEGELRNVNTWIDGLAAALDVPAPSAEAVDAILDLTRVVAHGTERTNGPLASFLAGYLAARSGDSLEAIRAVTDRAQQLIDAG